MHRTPFVIAFISIFFTNIVCAQSIPGRTEEAAIRELVGKYMEARNSRNAEATHALFTEDADQLVSPGEWRKGREAVIRGAMAASQKETGKSSIEVQAVRFLAPDVALVDGRYQTNTAGTGAGRNMRTTLAVQRTNLGWRIAAIRNMLPAPPPSSASH